MYTDKNNEKNIKISIQNHILISLIIIGLAISGVFSILAVLHHYNSSGINLYVIFIFFIIITIIMAFVSSIFIKKFLHKYLYRLLMYVRETSDIWSENSNIKINDGKDELTELEDNIKGILAQTKKEHEKVETQNKILQILSKQQKIQLGEIKNRMNELQALYDIGKVINSDLKFDTVINLAVSTTSKIMNCPLCSVRILDPEGKSLILSGSYGLSDEYRKKGNIKIGESIAGRVVLEKIPIAINNIRIDNRIIAPDYAIREGITSFLCVPLIAKDKSIGVISVYSFEEHKYSDDEIRLLSTFANQLSIAIENSRLYEETHHLAITDGLTDIYNHKYFREQLCLETQRAERYNRHISLIMIDVDNFKKFNDLYGHPAGDLALIKVAQNILNSARKSDIVARYGGEEFTIILPETDCVKAFEFADRLRKLIDEYDFMEGLNKRNSEAEKVSLTISAGISTFPTDAKTDADLINNADHALYIAKNSGKNNVRVYGVTDHTNFAYRQLS